IYPFGGAFNKYYTIFNRIPYSDIGSMDLVALRERLVMETCMKNQRYTAAGNGIKVGINRSLMTATLFPLYYGFFKSLGYDVVMPEGVDPHGCIRKGAAFCWPVEQAHGMLMALLALKPDIVFLPHIKAVPVPGGEDVRVTCPFVQAEPYILKAAFPELAHLTVLCPVLDMTNGYEQAEAVFIDMAEKLGHDAAAARAALQNAITAQNEFHASCREAGARMLAELEKTPDETAVVLFGRPYNALTALGKMGIPRKLATRGYKVIPLDFLPVETEDSFDNMYWATGQWILKASRFTARHPQLFGVYITNFSCGPDSFLIGYFRNIMEHKPSLTLELDSHTADAGLDTRIEAFLDVVKRYRIMEKQQLFKAPEPFITARVETKGGRTSVVDSNGVRFPLTHPRVKMLIPSMNELASRMMASTFKHVGVKAEALPPPGKRELDLGRALASCKECLPFLLTLGSLIRYVEEQWNREDILINFMPETSGPCRFGQYNIMMRELIGKLRLPDVSLLSLTAENGYAGFGVKLALRAWQSIVLSDVMEDVYSAILALAVNPEEAIKTFRTLSDSLCESIEHDPGPVLKQKIIQTARELSRIPRKGNIENIPSIALTGEIYVRRDSFSRQNLVERLSQQGFWVRTATLSEWIHYCDYIVQHKLAAKSRWFDRVRSILTCWVKNPYETRIRSLFADSGFYRVFDDKVEHLIESARDLISPRLTGEAILTVGTSLAEIVENVDGVLALGPFGCMPSRISEALVTQSLNTHKRKIAREAALIAHVMETHPALPFLSVETDGNTFPQLIESRLEAFLLQVRRVHETIRSFRQPPR
ncbi:MAG: acyl-CoA dehydratase activase-related protein, partial [Bacillota bacterium]|nr:acyl-CoA dehydratase activase-related protein [Bacillota bacterium]